MKSVNFDQHAQEIRLRARRYQLKQRARQPHRLARRRPRDADARRDLIQLAIKRRKQWLEDGRLEKLGPRHYRLHLDCGAERENDNSDPIYQSAPRRSTTT